MWTLSEGELERIHNATVALLCSEGIEFLSEKAVAVFASHGFKVDGNTVFFTDEQIRNALASCPGSFTIYARNPERNVRIGEGSPVCSPIYGPPYVLDFDGVLRRGTADDYHTLVKLAHMLPHQDMTGFILCDPSDIPAAQAHKFMLHASMTQSDKPFMGSPTQGARGVADMMQMGEVLFGASQTYLKEHPFSISLINSLTPLRYERHATEALMAFAEAGQALLVASLVTGGATGPVTMGGVLVLQNAEILAGIVLAQLVNPGVPVIYGCASGIMDMRSVIVALGAPEFSQLMRAAVQLGHWYGLPCRGGGCLTEACDVDAQAGYESMGTMLTAVQTGVDFVQHSCGCIASYMGVSFTKFVMDDEIIGHVKAQMRPICLDEGEEGMALDVIREVGKGGEYITNMHTAMNCRDAAWMPDVSYRGGLEQWDAQGRPSISDAFRKRGLELLEAHRAPALDNDIASSLAAFLK